MRVETIDIAEPDKDTVRGFEAGQPFDRIARYNVFKRGKLGVWQGRIDLKAGTILKEHFDENARAMVAVEEVLEIEKAVKADPRFREALRRRGLLDEVEFMCIDPWTVGEFGHDVEKGRRVLNCFVWMRTFPLDNYYAHPVEGLHALIDLSTLEILRVDDHFEADGDYIPVPRTPLNYDADVLTSVSRPPRRRSMWCSRHGAGLSRSRATTSSGRTGISASASTAARGWCSTPSATRMTARRRPVLYRASIAEMVVPYGTPERSHYRKNVFDSGEIGFGRHGQLPDAGLRLSRRDPLLRRRGAGRVRPCARTIENAICLHEEDAGLAWKHFDVRTGGPRCGVPASW